MGADLSALLPQAIAAGGQGYLQGREQRLNEDQTRQMMALRAAQEGREAELHPLAVQGQRNVLAREPLVRESAEQGLRGGRPVSGGFADIVRAASGSRNVDVSGEDRDTAELVYKLELQRSAAAERARIMAADQTRDDELRAWQQSSSRNKIAVAAAEDEVKRMNATVAVAQRAVKDAQFNREQKKAAQDELDNLLLRQRAANIKATKLRVESAQADDQFRARFKQRYGVDPGGISPETITPTQNILGSYGDDQ